MMMMFNTIYTMSLHIIINIIWRSGFLTSHDWGNYAVSGNWSGFLTSQVMTQ